MLVVVLIVFTEAFGSLRVGNCALGRLDLYCKTIYLAGNGIEGSNLIQSVCAYLLMMEERLSTALSTIQQQRR